MPQLRLNPAALAVETATGLVLRTPQGTFALEGRDAPAVLHGLLPVLDGSRDAPAIAAALAGFSRVSVLAFLDLLVQRGLVEPVESSTEENLPPGQRGQEAVFAPWTDRPRATGARLAAARVLIAGLEPWGMTAARALTAAGVGAVRQVADVLNNEGVPALPEGPWDLVLVAAAAWDFWLLDRLARAAQPAGARSLTATLDGQEAVLGPLVVPGQTACWNCARLRQLANARHREASHILQAALLAARPAVRPTECFAPAAAQLGQLLALATLEILAGAAESPLLGRLLVQDLGTLETTRHTVIRMPWCAVCGGAASAGAGAEAEDAGAADRGLDTAADAEELRARLAGWVDPRTGVIRRLALDSSAGAPHLPLLATAETGVYTEGTYAAKEPLVCGGKGRSATEALIGAVGEAIERYSAARYRSADLLRCPPAALQDDFIDPRDLALFTAAQYATPGFPFRPVDPDQPLDWVRGAWLDTGAPVWVPALPTYFRAPTEDGFCPVNSSGLAAGAAFADAARRAVWEVIERDALMITWYARLSARPVLADRSLPPEARLVVRQLAALGVAVELYLLDAGLRIPTIAGLALGDGQEWPGLHLTLAAHPDPRVAARRALFELAQTLPGLRWAMHEGQVTAPATAGDVHTLLDHAYYYLPRERAALADALRRGGEPVSLADLAAAGDGSLVATAAQLAGTGVRIALVDVTAPDVRQGPFRVVRAIGPGLVPFRFGHDLQALAAPRLRARLLGEPNPHPHPVA